MFGFGQQQPQQQANAFGQPSTSLFGTQTQPPVTSFGAASSGFGTQSSFGGGLTSTPTGTKFAPVAGTDSVLKNGSTTTITTKHQCLTAMNEYSNKALEELRFEDYASGRNKGVANITGVSGFGQTQQQPTSSGFSFNFPASTSNSIFGKPTTSIGFGTPAVQQPGTSLFQTGFGQQPQQQQNKPLFGNTATTTNLFGGGLNTTPGTSIFGQQQPTQPVATTPFSFGSPAAAAPKPAVGLFGTQLSQPSAPTPLFNAQQPQQQPFGGIGLNKPTTSLFPMTSTANAFGSLTQTQTPFSLGAAPATSTAPSLFGQQPVSSAAPFSFNTPSATLTLPSQSKAPFSFPSFGTTNTVVSQPSLFSTPATSAPSFGFGTTTTGSLFNPTTSQSAFPALNFGTGSTAGGFSFGQPTQAQNLFSQGLQQQQPQPVSSSHDLLMTRLRTLPYGTNPAPIKFKSVTDISSLKMTPGKKVHFFEGSGKYLTVCGNKVTIYSGLEDYKKSMEERFSVQLKNHSFLTTSTSCPIPVAGVKKKVVNSMNSKSLNLLILALYGDILKTGEGEADLYEQEEVRRNCLIDWLIQRNADKYRIPLTGDPVSKIFYFLCLNDIKSAVDEAVKSHQPRLVLLLSCGLCTLTRDQALAQLDSWKSSGGDAFIEEGILRLFILVSGSMSWTISTGQVISCMTGLEWSQELTLALIYNQETGLSECISSSLPPEIVKSRELANDIEMHLIANYNDSQWKSLSQCQSLLETWFLHQSLAAFNAIPIDDVVLSDSLHGQVVSQLVHTNIKWAAFVSLFIRDDDLRKKTLSEVLHVNAHSIIKDNEVESFLTETLLIPNKEVASAKAVFFKANFSFLEEAKALIEAGRYSLAHDILMDKVFPDLVIQSETDELKDLLDSLRPHRESISSWFSSGGHIYDVYCESLLGSTHSLMKEHPVNMYAMKTVTPKQTLARSEMVQKLMSLDDANLSCLVSAPLPDDTVLANLDLQTNKLLDSLLQ